MANNIEATLSCPAIGATLLVTNAVVTEAISEPTRAVVEVAALDEVDGDDVIGAEAHLAISIDGEPVRHFHFIVVGARYEATHREGKQRCRFELSHELSLLGLRSDVRMFQDKNAKEIVTDVLDAAGVPAGHVSWSVQRTLGKRTYCVQHRETDLAFVSRLLEHEGIFYFIHDDDGGTHVTFADAQSAFPSIEAVEGDDTLQLLDESSHGPGVYDFALETRIVPGQSTVSDYNSSTPKATLTANNSLAGGAPGDWFEYPAGHQTAAEGEVLAKLRMEELNAGRVVGHGRSNRFSIQAGTWFQLTEPSRDALAAKYLIRTVEHHLSIRGAQGTGASVDYEARFTCIPHASAYRPPRRAPRGRVSGPQSIVVTGPGGEIHTDAEGRMKGQFFWDRVGKSDDKSSCWMRVGQLPIGGSLALARMTWEMAVVHVDGDPDRPVAVYRLYNAEKTSPYGYPAAKTRASFQTPSSPGGGKSNELRMEDGGGGMEFFANASKDWDAQTENNKSETIGVDDKLEVGVDCEVTIGANQTVSIGASETETISADAGLKVTSDRKKTVGASETVTVGDAVSADITGSDSETTGGSHTTLAAMGITKTSKGSFSVTVGGSMVSAAGMGVSLAVAGAKSETVGGAKITASGKSASETVIGALARTVGGVVVQAAAANCADSTKGSAAITVGGVALANSGSKVVLRADKISFMVGGTANLLGGGGILNLTPASAAFVGLVTLDASGSITLSGNPNLVG